MPINLKDEDRDIIRRIMNVYLPDARTYVYGSRAKGAAKPYSDLDLLVRCEQEIEFSQISNTKELMSASDLPFFVDIADWERLSPEFRSEIENDLVEL